MYLFVLAFWGRKLPVAGLRRASCDGDSGRTRPLASVCEDSGVIAANFMSLTGDSIDLCSGCSKSSPIVTESKSFTSANVDNDKHAFHHLSCTKTLRF